MLYRIEAHTRYLQLKKLIPRPLKQKANYTSLTYIIEPSLLQNNNFLKLVDTLKAEEPIRLLKNGFPEFDDYQLTSNKEYIPQYWQLAKAMETIPSDSIVVFTSARFASVKGKRPIINKNIEWIVINPDQTTKTALEAIQKENEIQVLYVHSDNQSLSFEKESIPINSTKINLNESNDSLGFTVNNIEQRLPMKKVEALKILMVSDDSFSKEAAYIEASFNALSKHLNRSITIDKVKELNNLKETEYAITVWLSAASTTEFTSKTLIFKPDAIAEKLITEGLHKNVFYLTKALNTENIVDEHLPEQLLKMLDLHNDLKNRIAQLDKRVIGKQELQTSKSVIQISKDQLITLNISKWFWVLLILLLIVERIIASLRKQ